MTRVLITLSLLLLGTAPVAAQDMPLSQILIDGEGWKKVANPGAKPQSMGNATVFAMSTNTMYFVVSGSPFLWARWIPEGGGGTFGAPYAPLRIKRGESGIGVTGLATDRDGRIYAATEIGVQVFDPTGRLCGVLTPAAPGKPEAMAFEGDTLTMWIGEAKYARKLRTEGVK